MSTRKKGGLLNKIWLGSEKSEDYARASLPSNRWELFWDIFKGRFGKLIIVNLLILLFMLPLIALIILKSMGVAGQGIIYPFSQCFGIGYQAPVSLTGFAESIALNCDIMFDLFMPLCFAIASIGLAGGAYIIRNIVWTEGVFVANDFWKGIKQNIKPMVLICLFYSLIFYATEVAGSFIDKNLALGTDIDGLLIALKIFIYAVFVFLTFTAIHMVTMCVTYDLSFIQLFRNSCLLTVSLLPTNIIFAVAGLIPFALILVGSTIQAIGLIFLILFDFSFFLLVWTVYCQWIYDNFINPRVKGAKINRGIYKKVEKTDKEKINKYKEQKTVEGGSAIFSHPVKPITDDELKIEELPQSFNRADIEKLERSKEAIIEDNERYIEEHKNDPEFKEKTALLEQKEKENKEREARIEKAKKELSKRKNK